MPAEPRTDLTVGDAGRSSGLALVCRAGRQLCAVPLLHVRETMRPMPVTPIPGAPAFVTGLALIRGAPVPVVLVEALLGASGAAAVNRYVTLGLGGRNVALALQAVLGIRHLPHAWSSELPPLLAKSGAESVALIGVLDRELLLVLESARLVPEAVWTALEAGDIP